nr:putative ribonuclease H-like domain-containing protein [Tanacetum cinerariifolium]
KDNTQDTSENTKFAKQPIVENLPKVGVTNDLSKPVTSNSVSTPQESKGVNNDKVIAPGMFRINPSKTSKEEKHVPNTVRVDNTKNRRPQPRRYTKHDRVPSASKSSRSKNKEAEVEEHHRNLMLSKNNKHILLACNNIQIESQDVISKVVCAMCKKCLISVNHDKCLHNYENGKNSRGCSNHMTGNIKLLINFVWKFMGTVLFGNDHVTVILGFGDLQWGNILITRSKDEAPAVIITFLKRITVLLQSPVIIIRTDNGTEFKNQVLKEYLDIVGISHQMSSVRTPQQNGVVERRNQTLVEDARTMLIFSHAPLFLWAEAIATACFTQNSSIIHRCFNKTPYKLING